MCEGIFSSQFENIIMYVYNLKYNVLCINMIFFLVLPPLILNSYYIIILMYLSHGLIHLIVLLLKRLLLLVEGEKRICLNLSLILK